MYEYLTYLHSADFRVDFGVGEELESAVVVVPTDKGTCVKH